MTRTLAVILVSLGFVLALAHPASADPAVAVPGTPGTHVCDPEVAGGYVLPVGQPCPVHETPTTVATHFCLGYGQAFPLDVPCPKPPATGCAVHPEEISCQGAKDPAVPDAGVGQVATTAPAATAEVSSTTPVTSAPQAATQRRSAPSKTHKRVAQTTTTTLPPLYFAMGHWMTWDEYLYTAHLLSGWW
jgi:hypothetical protein